MHAYGIVVSSLLEWILVASLYLHLIKRVAFYTCSGFMAVNLPFSVFIFCRNQLLFEHDLFKITPSFNTRSTCKSSDSATRPGVCVCVAYCCSVRWCNLSLRCHFQAFQRRGLFPEASGQLFLLHILSASQSQLHHPYAHGQCCAYWQSARPVFLQGPTHLTQTDAALQPWIYLPAGEHWTGHYWDTNWASSHRDGRSTAALPLSLLPP